MARQFITRREAVAVLFKILENGSVEDEDRRKIEDIIHCIEAELENFHEWGGDTSEAVILHFPPNSKPILSMDRDELKAIYMKYRFIPSESDKEETNTQIKRMLEIVKKLGCD